ADLSGAYLSGADLRGADLRGADLSGAYLSGADLRGADLSGADLSGAYLSGAYLRGADLSGAYLSGADLSGADLRGADLSGADLRGADLREIKTDLFEVLNAAPLEAAGVLEALRAGRVNGSVYNDGECGCLIGTIAILQGCGSYDVPGLRPDSSRPAEVWFLAIRRGDTPENNQVAAISAGWIEEWIAARPAAEPAIESVAP
ncbi:MAG: pentapeptide repeat-containing protein, partial [Ardenticatenales bacterium]